MPLSTRTVTLVGAPGAVFGDVGEAFAGDEPSGRLDERDERAGLGVELEIAAAGEAEVCQCAVQAVSLQGCGEQAAG